jgi:flagellar biosynthetic protein FliP
MKTPRVRTLVLLAAAVCLLALPAPLNAQDAPAGEAVTAPLAPGVPGVGEVLEVVDKAVPRPGPDEQGSDWSAPVRMAVVFTLLALLPSMLVMMTSFTRIVIVMGFVRRALSTQNIPPTMAILGLSLFLTLFIMAPVFARVNELALQPYLSDEITFPAALTRGEGVLKEFMITQTREEDLALFVDLSRTPPPERATDLPSFVTVPAFAISEFRTAFEMGALLFVPFLLIDLVIAAVLLSTGMMMLPPSMISLPFKIIVFVLVDGWRLLAETLVNSFQWGLSG